MLVTSRPRQNSRSIRTRISPVASRNRYCALRTSFFREPVKDTRLPTRAVLACSTVVTLDWAEPENCADAEPWREMVKQAAAKDSLPKCIRRTGTSFKRIYILLCRQGLLLTMTCVPEHWQAERPVKLVVVVAGGRGAIGAIRKRAAWRCYPANFPLPPLVRMLSALRGGGWLQGVQSCTVRQGPGCSAVTTTSTGCPCLSRRAPSPPLPRSALSSGRFPPGPCAPSRPRRCGFP